MRVQVSVRLANKASLRLRAQRRLKIAGFVPSLLTTCSMMVVRTNSAISLTRPEIGFNSFSPTQITQQIYTAHSLLHMTSGEGDRTFVCGVSRWTLLRERGREGGREGGEGGRERGREGGRVMLLCVRGERRVYLREGP